MKESYDLCIIGGGINGAGIARDAAGRGLSVLLLEQGDLAQATSSASTKLIHGGLRYLEFYEFGLVRAALKEREVLLNMAPHIIWPLDFILPHHKDIRPLWMIKAGLLLYDSLGGREKLKPSKLLNLRIDKAGKPLKKEFRKGFRYSDCWVQDSRLVVLNAMDAAAKGADIMTYTTCTGIEAQKGSWIVKCKDNQTGKVSSIQADAIINAAGPWVETLLKENTFYESDKNLPHIKLVKGSHIIVPRQYSGEQCYILQQKDGRIVFAIPYERDFTLIGTTDENFEGDVSHIEISQSEITYLCEAYNSFFEKAIHPDDIVSSYSGVRALFDDGEEEARAVTRDYRIYDHKPCKAPALSIFGGKITTYRTLAEKAVSMLMPKLGKAENSWTAQTKLPGGDIAGITEFQDELRTRYAWLPSSLIERFSTHYGSLSEHILKGANALSDLGTHYGDEVYEAEIDYLMQYEFARTPEDILWRRTKLALHIQNETRKNIEKAIQKKAGEFP